MGASSIIVVRPTRDPPRWPLAVAVAVAAIVAGAALGTGAPQVLINTTPSEPPGLYVKTRQTPATGRIVAFDTPPAAFPYADRRLAYLHRMPLLKAVAAGPGDLVCTLNGALEIDGRVRAPIVQADRDGVVLPHWRACRRLAADEVFVFSGRVPNSFDSRYFGPVHRTAIRGVFAPLVVLTSGGR